LNKSAHRLFLAGAYALLLGSAAYFALHGLSYYAAPLLERPRHPLYWDLKPGGRLGLRFGIAGAAMMVVMLLYSLRKRVALLRRWGPLNVWLDFHILLGVCGPVFILLHSSFKVGGLVALSFWSMVVVALSGVVGRFLYSQIPRSRSGDELSLAEAEKLDAELSRRLAERFGLAEDEVHRLDAISAALADPRSRRARLALSWPLDSLRLRRQLRRFRRRHPEVPPALQREFAAVVARKAELRSRLLMWRRLHEIFHYWHVVHKPFAVLMYLFMIVHIAVAWMTGYAWVAR
jgi:hypothetical protein